MATTETPVMNGTARETDSIKRGRASSSRDAGATVDRVTIGLEAEVLAGGGAAPTEADHPAGGPVDPGEQASLIAQTHDLIQRVGALTAVHEALHTLAAQQAVRGVAVETGTKRQGSSQQPPDPAEDACTTASQLKDFQNRLLNLEKNTFARTSGACTSARCRSELRCIDSGVDTVAARVRSAFANLVYSSLLSKNIVENLVTRIDYVEFRNEAAMHLSVIEQLASKLPGDTLTAPDFDVATTQAAHALGIMIMIEDHRLKVEQLVRDNDAQLRRLTQRGFAYIAGAIVLGFGLGMGPLNGIQPMDATVPLLNGPAGILIWSLIGGLVAVMRRFRTNPIYDLGDSTRWMLIRPIEGALLAIVAYFVLKSGLFVLVGSPTGGTPDTVFQVIAFLIGFHDGFAERMFRDVYGRLLPGGKAKP